MAESKLPSGEPRTAGQTQPLDRVINAFARVGVGVRKRLDQSAWLEGRSFKASVWVESHSVVVCVSQWRVDLKRPVNVVVPLPLPADIVTFVDNELRNPKRARERTVGLSELSQLSSDFSQLVSRIEGSDEDILSAVDFGEPKSRARPAPFVPTNRIGQVGNPSRRSFVTRKRKGK